MAPSARLSWNDKGTPVRKPGSQSHRPVPREGSGAATGIGRRAEAPLPRPSASPAQAERWMRDKVFGRFGSALRQVAAPMTTYSYGWGVVVRLIDPTSGFQLMRVTVPPSWTRASRRRQPPRSCIRDASRGGFADASDAAVRGQAASEKESGRPVHDPDAGYFES